MEAFILNAAEEQSLRGFSVYYDEIVKPMVKNSLVKGDNPGPNVIWKTIAKLNLDRELKLDILHSSDDEKFLLDFKSLPQIQPQ